jgi:hypothetical protein
MSSLEMMDESADPAEIEAEATTAIWCGMGGLVCASLSPFACYLPAFIGVGLAGYGVWKSWSVQQRLPAEDSPVRTLSNVGMVAGGVGFLLAGLYCAIILFVIIVYGLMFLFMMFAGALGVAGVH